MTLRDSSSTRPHLGVAVPVGAWDPRLPFALASLGEIAPVSVAFLDASDDPRVEHAADASGLTFAYRRQGSDAGQSAAIQEGWDHLRDAEILAWLNADDILFAEGVEQALAAFAADPALDVHYSGSTIVTATGMTAGTHPQVCSDPAMLLKACTISQPSCFVRRGAVEAAGGLDPALHYTMDWDLWARLYLSGARFQMGSGYASAVHWGSGTKTSSFGPRRLAEIARLTSKLSGPFQAIKAMLGMALHHAADAYSSNAPARLKIGPNSTLRLPVPNLGRHAASRLNIAVQGPSDALTVAASGAVWARAADGATLEFEVPVAPGDIASVELSARAPVKLLSCEWAPAAGNTR